MGKRKVLTKDSVPWLKKQSELGSIITSLPDMEEIKMQSGDYPTWFEKAALLCLMAVSNSCPVIFYQTDRKIDNHRISKAYLIMRAAEAANKRIIWHKIVLRTGVGKTDIMRPTYSHLICIGSKAVKAGKSTPDVFEAGGVLYPNGMGLNAAQAALEFARRYSDSVCDPFCGKGTVLALAEKMGFKNILGLDIDPEQTAFAKKIRYGSVKPKGKAIKRNRLLET